MENVKFTRAESKKIGEDMGIDWKKIPFDEFAMGINVELEHGLKDPKTNVTSNDETMTAKIALAHLNEFPDYYTRLKKLETEAKKYWSSR
jgi:hypothetical protein